MLGEGVIVGRFRGRDVLMRIDERIVRWSTATAAGVLQKAA